jgi:hypothetical protein
VFLEQRATANLTAPLYELIDEVFDLHDRNWLRKQLMYVATQLVQMTYGAALNDLLQEKVSPHRALSNHNSKYKHHHSNHKQVQSSHAIRSRLGGKSFSCAST